MPTARRSRDAVSDLETLNTGWCTRRGCGVGISDLRLRSWENVTSKMLSHIMSKLLGTVADIMQGGLSDLSGSRMHVYCTAQNIKFGVQISLA